MKPKITARKTRSVFALFLAMLYVAAPFGAAYAAEAQAKKDWAFRNEGDFYYEDNIGSNLGGIGIVRAVEGVDIIIKFSCFFSDCLDAPFVIDGNCCRIHFHKLISHFVNLFISDCCRAFDSSNHDLLQRRYVIDFLEGVF